MVESLEELVLLGTKELKEIVETRDRDETMSDDAMSTTSKR